MKQAARERLCCVEAGEVDKTIEQDVRFVLNSETDKDIERLMRPSTLRIIETIVTELPESVRNVSEEVDHDYWLVYICYRLLISVFLRMRHPIFQSDSY
jgi:hypothetical protein